MIFLVSSPSGTVGGGLSAAFSASDSSLERLLFLKDVSESMVAESRAEKNTVTRTPSRGIAAQQKRCCSACDNRRGGEFIV